VQILMKIDLVFPTRFCLSGQLYTYQQIAHLVFAYTQIDPKKPKELFFPTLEKQNSLILIILLAIILIKKYTCILQLLIKQ